MCLVICDVPFHLLIIAYSHIIRSPRIRRLFRSFEREGRNEAESSRYCAVFSARQFDANWGCASFHHIFSSLLVRISFQESKYSFWNFHHFAAAVVLSCFEISHWAPFHFLSFPPFCLFSLFLSLSLSSSVNVPIVLVSASFVMMIMMRSSICARSLHLPNSLSFLVLPSFSFCLSVFCLLWLSSSVSAPIVLMFVRGSAVCIFRHHDHDALEIKHMH